MSKIKLEAPFKAFRGKICKHSDIIYKKMKQTQYTSQICNPRTKPFSAEELARQTKFTTITTDNVRWREAKAESDLTCEAQLSTEGIDEVQRNNVLCTKVLIDGELYIILPDERIYNALGAEMK